MSDEAQSQVTRGDFVCTAKGANFEGIVLVVYEKLDGSLGAVVEAIADGFEGTTHVYPIGQLKLVGRGELFSRKLRRTGG
jgi:hypothetical protein